jgi:methylmalonyl-CoA mutase
MYAMTPEYGAASQLEKINMIDYADIICMNKFDKSGAKDALHDVRKQYKRSHQLWDAADETLPVVGTIAAQFNDPGIHKLVDLIFETVANKTGIVFTPTAHVNSVSEELKKVAQQAPIIPANKVRYLAEIATSNRSYDVWVLEQVALATKLYQLNGTLEILDTHKNDIAVNEVTKAKENIVAALDPNCKVLIDNWPSVVEKYTADFLTYTIRDKNISIPLTTTSLSGSKIAKVMLPTYSDSGSILKWQLQENVPGKFPFTAGVFELKREGEDPTRMFAGEGCPERTNRRFHYVSVDQPAIRLSTAFDSVTLYGEDPATRPDIFGKIGNSGVNIATIDDAKKLYSGFDLCDPKTSVSMTINGPAPIILAFFMHAAIDQLCEKWIASNNAKHLVEKALQTKYGSLAAPHYAVSDSGGKLPEGNSGLGLQLLGLSGDEVLPPDV